MSTLDIEINQGEDLELTFTCKDPDNVAFSLVGWSVRAALETPTPIDLAPMITDAAAGTIRIFVYGSTTATWSFGVVPWHLEIFKVEGANESVVTRLDGNATLE